MLRICVLLSIGQHPVSGRARRANLDAKAVSLALDLEEAGVAQIVGVVHCGTGDVAVLREYLGMGLTLIDQIETDPRTDITEALAAYVRGVRADLVLAGRCAECGLASGELPYRLSNTLGADHAAAITGLEVGASGLKVVEALPNGYRREMRCSLPAVATIAAQAPTARPSAYARARRGQVVAYKSEVPIPAEPRARMVQPAARRAPGQRLRANASAAERRLAMIGKVGANRMILGSPDKAAREIWDYLLAEGLVAGPDRKTGTSN